MKKKKGFTLVELLAVVVILAVIALITTPIVLSTMKSMRKNTFKNSTYGMIESAKIYYSNQTKEYDFTGKTFKFENNQKIMELDYDGKNMKSGQIEVKENGEIEIYVTDGEFCAYKPFDNTEVMITEVTEKGCGKNLEVPEISVVGNKVTTDTISLVASCTLESGSKAKVIKYEFSKDGGKNWNSKIVKGKYLNYFTYSSLKQSENYTFKSRCITDVGTIAEKDANVSLKNLTKPIVVIPGGWAKSKEITINYPKGRYKYQISEDEGKTWKDVEVTSESEYNVYKKTYIENKTILARVLDQTENYIDSDSGKITGIDRKPPTCGTWSGGSTSWTNQNRTIKVGCTDDYSGCTASTYNVKTYTSGTTSRSSLSYTIKDKAGNEKLCSNSSVNVYVDKEGPNKPGISLTYGTGGSVIGTYTSGSWTKYDVLTEVTSSDSGSGVSYYQYSHNGTNGWSNDISKLGWSTAYYNNRNTLHYWITWGGQWNFYVRAIDNLGNVSPVSNVFTLRIDKAAPTISFGRNGTGGAWSKSSATTITATENESGLAELRGRWIQGTGALSSKNDFTGAGGWSFTNGGPSQGNPSDGSWYLWIYARDNAGNEMITHTNEFKVDNTPPSITIEPGDGTYYSGFIASVSCYDDGSGMPGNGTYFHDYGTDAGSNTYGQYYTEQKLASRGNRCPTCANTAYGTCTDNLGNSVTVHRSWNVVRSGTSGGTTAATPGCSCEGGCVCKSTSNGQTIYSCQAHEACARACGIPVSATCGR